MFFTLSKIAGFLLAPSNALFILGAAGLALLLTPWRGLAIVLAGLSLLGLGLVGFSPLGNWLMRPLEDRFPAWDGAAPDGIVVLGGSVSVSVSAERGVLAVNESAERLFAILDLGRRFPEARMVFTGGYGGLGEAATTEAEISRLLLETAGFDTSRMVLEDRSRNTAENAAFTAAMVAPQTGETWLLVTSAYHMPRAMGVFRKAGFPVTAYPTDYRTPRTAFTAFSSLADGLKRTDIAAREWVGLIAYRLSGRTDALFPAP